jgi:hypothetical protein
MSTFGGGGGGADCLCCLLANTKEPMTTNKPSENETERIIGDQSFLPRALGVSGFILDANVGLQINPAGIVLRFYCTPNRAVQPAQLKLITPADAKFPEWLPAQADVSGVHHKDLFLLIFARNHFLHIVNESDQKFLIRQ